ncbi:manganese transporter [Mycolicibacterium agri]|uniref:Manganese transporter n=3 Tax=Mycolicibacterium agri TaxID=36811 RepID=A0A2A7MYR0_MYCAG|nr:Nramp family divalent metal transporter [Mycolicibacterium agri]PEG36804.1 manganese transporter [Mycolicibacterium agri]
MRLPMSSTRSEVSPTRTRFGRKTILLVLGPAVLAAAWQFGPGNISTAATIGAKYGYSMIWVIVFSGLLALAFLDMGVRIGISTKESPITIIRRDLGRWVGVILGCAYILLVLTYQVGNTLGAQVGIASATGSSMIGTVGIWVSVVVALALVWAPGSFYKYLERSMTALVGLMVAIFLVTAFVSHPDWASAAKGLIPTPPEGGISIQFLALLGTSVSVNSAFFVIYSIKEKGTQASSYRESTIVDTVCGGIVSPALMTSLIVVAAAAILPPLGITAIGSGEELAQVLEPVAGSYASVIFGLGIFAAGFTSMMVASAAGGLVLNDALGVSGDLNQRRVRVITSAVLIFGLIATLITGGQLPVQIIVTVQAVTLFFTPFLGLALIWLSNRGSLMGSLRSRWYQNALAIAGWLVLVVGSVLTAHEIVGMF